MKLLSSVKKSLQVLNTFSTEQPDLSVTEISRLLDSHKSSISRILMTLASEGYVEKDPATQKYRLGLKVLELAGRVINRYDLRHLAGPYLDELAKELGEIIHLSILDGNEIVYLEKKGREQPLTVSSKVGGRSPAYASARGKVLLSGLPEKVLMQVITKRPLVRFTANTIVEIPDLMAELARIREQGFATDMEEAVQGIRCVATPILGRDGEIIAAISATVPKQRMGVRRMNQIRKRVVETARLISNHVAISAVYQ
jgi:IclR family KDG regulon transcriptional repressor